MGSLVNQAVPHYSIAQLRLHQWTQLKSYLQYASNEHDVHVQKELLVGVDKTLKSLAEIEQFFAYPGKSKIDVLMKHFADGGHTAIVQEVKRVLRVLTSETYRLDPQQHDDQSIDLPTALDVSPETAVDDTKYFEVLFVDNLNSEDEAKLHATLARLRDSHEQFYYRFLVQHSFQDALLALIFNHNIQAVVVRYAPRFESNNITDQLRPYAHTALQYNYADMAEADLGPLLGSVIKELRPELDVYYITDTPLNKLKDSTITLFKRIFYRSEDIQELHLGIIRGIHERYETPFFSALKEYAMKPTGVFHAMPISRGNSVFKSQWIQDFGEFYGRNMFLAETSSTTGGLDSLLQPTGPLKKAQEMASEAYGSQRTFFVTNGTSTANKIVVQALVEPGDLVLIDRDCHKSHHYGLMLSGAYPVYLDSYPIEEYSMYGAVPLNHIKKKLLTLKAAGRLNKVKMLLLTNCTFDGLVYNVQRVMEEVLAIKPDIVFLWDEAWFGFAGFTYTYKQRTGMFSAAKLRARYSSAEYQAEYNEHIKNLQPGEEPSMPDPAKVKVRVYSTQSTHKTLSSFRQGSMVHIWDEEYKRKAERSFLEAYMTHTSTSPNYQVLASLDVGRRQVQFEGTEMVEKAVELAMVLREKITENEKLSKYFDVLTVHNFIPDEYRSSDLTEYYALGAGLNRMEKAWESDEFVLDPTKVTLYVGKTGIDGDTFKNKYLMDQFNIQINKTSRNSVLFMTNIGTTRGSVAYLTNALMKIAEQIEADVASMSAAERKAWEKNVESLTKDVPPLPDFSHFHASFQAVPGVPGGNIREAFFASYNEDNCEYRSLEECLETIDRGEQVVSSAFVIPYPPGFPVLVPGQVASKEIVEFLLALDVKEIHGYRKDLGLNIFRSSVLQRQHVHSALGAVAAKH